MRSSAFPLLASWLLALPACDTRRPAAPETAVATPADSATTADVPPAALGQQRLQFGAPVVLDSAACVLYPLELKPEEEEESHGFKSRSYGNQPRFWNMLFYDPRSGATRPLSTGRKLVIYSYETAATREGTDAGGPAAATPLAARLLLYSVVTDDFNRDGVLDRHDPMYYFVSDKDGRNFRQVSPAGHDALYWLPLPGRSKVLLGVLADTNHDRQFRRDEDTVVPLVLDLAAPATPAAPVFGRALRTQLSAELARHWGTKQAK